MIMLRRPPKDGMPGGREENDHRDVIMKVPIVLAAFGTTTSARQSYTYLDAHIRAAFPAHEVHWAFSSRMVRDFDQQRRGRKWKGPGELLEELKARGFEWAVVQALNLVAGHEFYR